MATTSPRSIAALDVPAEQVAAEATSLPACELAHLLDANDANYIHCATDPDAQVPDSDWTPGGTR